MTTTTATIIDGRALAQIEKDNLKKQIADHNLTPSLSVILVGDNTASALYVEKKRQACAEVGIKGQIHPLPASVNEDDLIAFIQKLNSDTTINGILLQLPIPAHLNAHRVINAIAPEKDVDGLTAMNMGNLISDRPTLVPCTPQGVLKLIKSVENNLEGKHAVIIGRSLLFGKPMGQLLLAENCTVTQCHSKTRDIQRHTKNADILIVAAGRPKFVSGEWVKDGAIVIDVGINTDENGKLCGDVDFESVKNKALAITPVPGGVGPMTVACLLGNTVKASLI